VALQNRYKDRLQIIGLVVDDDDEKGIRKVIDSEGIKLPCRPDRFRHALAYAASPRFQTVFVINPMAASSKTRRPVQSRSYETEVRALLGLPVAAKVETFRMRRHFSEARRPRQNSSRVDMTDFPPNSADARVTKFNASLTCGAIHPANPHFTTPLADQSEAHRGKSSRDSQT